MRAWPGESRFQRWCRFIHDPAALPPGFEMSAAPLALDTFQEISAFALRYSFVIRHSDFVI